MCFRRCAVLLAALLFVSIASSAASPNVVLVSLDTFRVDRLAPWGGAEDLTPNLNALATKGSVFTGCFAPAPITLPSHATMLTGAFPDQTGLRDNGFGHLAASVPTLAEILAARGYATAAIVAAPVLDHRYGLSRGFATYDDALGSAVSRTAEDVTNRALAQIKSARGAPLFMWVHYFDAHFPYEAPAAFSRRSAKGPYDGAVAYVDSEVGRLLKALPPNTVVAIVSDHGEALGDHGELTHGIFLFQPTMHVVCILEGPGVPAGKRCSAPTSLGDVARTLAVLAGAPASSLQGEGVDLMTLCTGGEAPYRVFPMEAWPPYSQYRWHPLFGVTDGRYKWVRGRKDHLYDLSVDPAESKDLAAAPPSGALALKAKLPKPPKAAPSEGQVDPALLGLGYAPAPGGRFNPAALPGPYDKVGVLTDINEGKVARVKGQYDKAVARLKVATERDPGNPAAWFEYGETLRRAGRIDEAISALNRALAIAPQVYEAWTSKGNALVAQNKGEEAIRCYKKALALQPDYAPALNPVAAYHLDRNELGTARSLVDGAISRGVANANTYLLGGEIGLAQQRNDDAAEYFETAVKISPSPERTLNEEADLYMAYRQFDSGQRLYLEGIRRYPAYAPNYLAMGSYALQIEKSPEKAVSFFEKALDCDLPPKTREQVQQVVRRLKASAASAGTE
jgi:choline-sulfatase